MTGSSVLIVEDDHELRDALRRGLTEEGFETDTASRGAELLARVRPQLPICSWSTSGCRKRTAAISGRRFAPAASSADPLPHGPRRAPGSARGLRGRRRLDAYLARVRRKLRELEGASAITTVHGVGYPAG